MGDLNAVPLWDQPPPPDCPVPTIPSNISVHSLLLLPHLPQPPLPPRTRPLGFALSVQVAHVNSEELREREIPCKIDILTTLDSLTLRTDRQSRSFIDDRYGSPDRTPLWVLGWWLTFHRAVEARDRWRVARAWLAEVRYDCDSPQHPDYHLATTALGTFHRLPWDERLHAAYGLLPEDLSHFLATNPVSAPMLDAMLDALNERIRAHPLLHARVVVLGLAAYCILQATPDKWVTYDTAPRFTFLRDLSERLRRPVDPADTVYLPWHAHGAWVLFVLDARANTIRYADSSGAPPSPSDLGALQTWFTAAQLGVWSVGPPIPCGHPDDGVSCGIVIVNAIRHALFGEPLWDVGQRSSFRIREYLNVARAYVTRLG
ncbi:hypothetical protein C8Q76DRAFT_801302 [Earliella scabrosa]|nr:hypothetical protein C8Q76DRAFT_801302 [Earliella scabrosa]